MRARLSPPDLETWIVGDVGMEEACVEAEVDMFVTGTTTWTVKEGVSEQVVEYVAAAPSSASAEKIVVCLGSAPRNGGIEKVRIAPVGVGIVAPGAVTWPDAESGRSKPPFFAQDAKSSPCSMT